MVKLLTCILLIVSTLTCPGQGTPQLKQATAVKRKVETLAPDAKISVIPMHAPEVFGTFVSRSGEDFTFYNVDSKANETLVYTDVRKVKNGYAGYNSATGRHVDRDKQLIVTFIALGVLGGLLAAVATARN